MKRKAQDNHFTTTDNQVLFYSYWKSETEKPERTILLLHRGHEHSGRLQHIVDEMQLPNTAFFAWDMRGCGKTEGKRGFSPSFMTWVYDLNAFVKHIKTNHQTPENEIVVVAQSVGAVIAAAWVHDFAPKIKGLVLASPAFSVDLIFPFALESIKFLHKIKGTFFVKSYVKGKQLTHDEERAKSYHNDPLVTLPISSNVLIELYDVSDRIIKDAGAIITPTQVLISGDDAVVRYQPQKDFYNNLSATLKEVHIMQGFHHDTLGEKDRNQAFDLIKNFISKIEALDTKVNLLEAHQRGYTYTEYQELLMPKSPNFWNEINFSMTRKSMKYIGKHASQGIKLGVDTGFDSGSTLDYVYKNKIKSLGVFKLIGFGQLIDKIYLESIGWRGIRIRKINLETLIRKYIIQLNQYNSNKINILDIASGHGRYILDAVSPLKEKINHIKLRDYSEINVKAGKELIKEKQLSDIATFVNANAFDGDSIANENPKPDLVVVSGLYELFSDNMLIMNSLKGIYKAIDSGYLIYTNQPWHPQVELIARTLNNHQGNHKWVMRRRTQAEMDQLVANAGFEKMEQLQDDWGIFTVSVARKI